MLDWALRYVRLGWPVIPLKGKLPLTENGSKDASLNEGQIRAWWEKWPNANIGLATGHRFFVVDVDIKGGGEDTWDMLRAQHAALPETIEAVTGTGGRHILYALPSEFPVNNSQGKIGPGIDVRGKGGYIVAAPSVHPETKRRYSWDGLQEIEQQAIAPAPAWLLGLLKAADQRKEPLKIPDRIAAGGRNDLLFRAACRLRRIAFGEEEIFASLKEINRQRCNPPLEERELRTIAGSAARYAPTADVFSASQTAHKAPGTQESELPVGPSDVEAAVDTFIAEKNLAGAVGLAEEIKKLSAVAKLVIEAKLRQAFGDKFPARAFADAVKVIPIREERSPEADAEASEGPDLLTQPFTDSGNGERMRLMFGTEIRYCIEMQKWLVWDTQRWRVDEAGKATQLAKKMARTLYAQGTGKAGCDKWARQSESQAGITATLKRAASEPGIPVHAVELDQHPYLLNCPNGVVDMRSGDLLKHDRRYLITKMCQITYDPAAECPQFLKFLHWAMGADDASDAAELPAKVVHLVGFLQRAFGYALTGDVGEKCLFIFYGHRGNNGKTTLLALFRALFPEYSAQLSIDVLMTSKAQDAALRADMADLRGARFVMTSEVEQEHKLGEGKLKYITAGAGAPIKSCRKYENPIEFLPTHKLFMDCNHRPRVAGTDDAIWNRLKPIPFEVSISKEEMDKKLGEKLAAEAAGVLAWVVRGCKWWLREGLGNPPEIDAANEAWREHDDPLKEFLEDCCEIPEGHEPPEEVEKLFWCKCSDLSNTYAWWCKQQREKFPLGRERFKERVLSKGHGAGRGAAKENRSRREEGKQMRSYEGLRIRGEVLVKVRATEGSWRPLE